MKHEQNSPVYRLTKKLPELNTRIAVGTNKDAPFLAFGDDSQHKGLLTFAYIVVPKSKTQRLMRELDRLKRQFRIPKDVPIHCRVLFSGHQREKCGLAHFKRDDPLRLVHHVVTLMNKYDLFIRYAFAREETWKGLWEGKSVSELHDDSGAPVEISVTQDPKGVLGMLAQACWAAPDTNGPRAIDCEMYASKDPTPTRFMGQQKRQAHHWIRGLSTVNAPEGAWLEISPSFEPSEYAPLLELADVAAYIYCHALHGRAKEPQFVELAERIRYWSRAEFHLDFNRPL